MENSLADCFSFWGLFMQILWCLCWYHICSRNFNL